MQRMPVGFIGHGNPLAVVDPGRTRPWELWAQALPRPDSILIVSAHWEDSPVTIGATTRHDRLLYDFWGFPGFMYELQYAAPGAPRLADRVESLLAPSVTVARSDRLLDHGAWIPLMRMWPGADIPILQISMPIDMDEEDLYELGAELSPLRDERVFILGTGNLVHNLGAANLLGDPPPPDYVAEFDSWVAGSLNARDDQALLSWQERAPDALLSHPSAEHYRPIIVAAGAARDSRARFPVEGFEHGTISRRSVHLGD